MSHNSNMGKMLNRYSEEFRRNVVALVKSGISPGQVSARLEISRYTVYDWMHSSKYADVLPANQELIKSLPIPGVVQTLVPVTKTEENKCSTICSIKMNIGKLQIECSNENLVPVLKAFGEAGVL